MIREKIGTDGKLNHEINVPNFKKKRIKRGIKKRKEDTETDNMEERGEGEKVKIKI